MFFTAVLGVAAFLSVSIQSASHDRHHVAKRFDWQDGNNGQVLWSEHCDFYGNDLYSVQGSGDQCGGSCLSNSQCTHFTWTEYNGGTCYLKQGAVTTDQATYYSDYSVCGVVKGTPGGQPGVTTRYWDCCKPSCSWPGKGPVTNPVQSCQKDGWTPADPNAPSGCGGGTAYTCATQQPWAINDNLAYGFAAANIQGSNEQGWCCACYQLTFTSTSISGKQLVVQITNTGADLGNNHFDLQIPGGGVGLNNACTSQYNAPPNGWGDQYGGVSSRDQCNQLPGDLQPGCFWRFDWFQNAQNPNVMMNRVKCPDELVQKSNCRRTDE